MQRNLQKIRENLTEKRKKFEAKIGENVESVRNVSIKYLEAIRDSAKVSEKVRKIGIKFTRHMKKSKESLEN